MANPVLRKYHEPSGEIPMAETVQRLCRLSGRNQASLARRFRVSEAMVSAVRNGLQPSVQLVLRMLRLAEELGDEILIGKFSAFVSKRAGGPVVTVRSEEERARVRSMLAEWRRSGL
jgi:transcriptional regulator with XRE-family HTH domain